MSNAAPEPVVIVTWNKPSLKIIGENPLSGVPATRLMPGANVVPAKKWQRFMERSDIMHGIRAGYIEVEGLDTFEALSPAKQAKKVDECADLELLARWRSKASPRVQLIIDERARMLAPKGAESTV